MSSNKLNLSKATYGDKSANHIWRSPSPYNENDLNALKIAKLYSFLLYVSTSCMYEIICWIFCLQQLTKFLCVKGKKESLEFSSTWDIVTSKSAMAMASATVCFWCKTSLGVSHYVKYKEPNQGEGFEIVEEKSVQRWLPIYFMLSFMFQN